MLENKEQKQSFIEQCIAESTEVEFISEGIRRKDKQLPDLIQEKKNQNIKVILSISCEVEDSKVSWKEIERTLKEKFQGIDINYTRMKGKTGNLGLTSLNCIEKLQSEPVDIQGQKLTFKKIEGQELEQFWIEHGEHYKLCAYQAGQKNKKQNRNNQKNKKQRQDNEEEQVVLGSKTFNSVREAKNFIRSLTNKIGQVPQQHFNLFLDLLKRHPNSQKKLGSGAKSFEVGQHPQFPGSKCLFVVREDGSKEDFSLSKCLD